MSDRLTVRSDPDEEFNRWDPYELPSGTTVDIPCSGGTLQHPVEEKVKLQVLIQAPAVEEKNKEEDHWIY